MGSVANVSNNQRFRDTDRRIEEASLELAEEGARLTVKAICERAQVNRSTFYAHFLDVSDMMEKLESRLSRELFDRYLEKRGETGKATVPLTAESFLPFLEHIKAHRSFYRAALATRRDFPLKQGRDQIWKEVVEPLSRRAGITEAEHMTCLFVAFQAGFTMVLRRWVDADCPEPVEKMSEIIASCVPRAWVSE